MENFTPAEDLSEEDKKHCVKLIEKGMNYCDECSENASEENIMEACIKHKKMYGTIHP